MHIHKNTFTQSSIANANRMNCETHPRSFHRFYILFSSSEYNNIYQLSSFSFTHLLQTFYLDFLHEHFLFYSRDTSPHPCTYSLYCTCTCITLLPFFPSSTLRLFLCSLELYHIFVYFSN